MSGFSVLDEVVVVGYGTQGRGKVSAAVSQTDYEALQIDKRPVTNVQTSLVGAVPGLIIRPESGEVGQNIDLQVRAVSALESRNALILIDGFEGSINDINPNDIESVSVLKDAAATAIYGARSANGVVLITTKNTARNEKLSATYSFNFSRQTPAQTAELLNSLDFMEFSNEATLSEALRNNPNADPNSISLPYSEDDLARARSGFYPETKWVEELYSENANQFNHNLSLAGGGQRVGYLLNFGYLDQDGLAVGPDNFQRINLRVKVDADVTDWLTVGVNAFNTNSNLHRASVVQGDNVRGKPFFPIRLADGTYVDKGAAGGEPNPIALAKSGSYDKTKRDALNAQLYGRITPLENLAIESRVSYVNSNQFREQWSNPYPFTVLDLELNPTGDIIQPNPADRNLAFRTDRIYTLNTLTTANYEFSLPNRHNFNVLVGFQSQEGESSRFDAERANFILPNLQSLSLGQVINGLGNSSERGDNRTTLSYFGRLAYDLDSKYLFEVNFRADASSNFSANNRWGYFPAVSAGWNVAEEGFLDNVNWIDVLKIRASWGLNGDDGEVIAVEKVDFNPNGAAFGGSVVPTLTLGDAVNQDLKWETSEKINLGLDVVLWRGKLGFTGEYFVDNRSDIITELLTSVEGGLEGVLDNVYDAKAWGWEFTVTHENTIGSVNYFADVNLTYYDSEITNTNGVSPLSTSAANFQDEGLPILGNLFGYETDGFFDNQAEIDAYVSADGTPIDQSAVVTQGDDLGRYVGGFKYVDQLTEDTDGDGVPDAPDGVIDADDRVVLKENTGDNYRIGFGAGVSYAGFTLSARFYGVLRGFQWWRGSLTPFTGDRASFAYQRDTWRPDNLDATFPQATASNIIPFENNVSHLIQNNAFLKIKNINLGYTFNQAVLNKLGIIKGLDVYLSVENLGVIWTNNPAFDFGWDPELEIDDFRYPLPLTASIGANVKF